MTSPCEKLIRRDIARTYPEHEFFKEKDSLGQEVLFNVMKVGFLLAWANGAMISIRDWKREFEWTGWWPGCRPIHEHIDMKSDHLKK